MGTNWSEAAGTLEVVPALQRGDLLAEPVERSLRDLDDPDAVGVVEIDPELADTAEFCAEYGSPLDVSANCVAVSGKRSGEVRHAGCVVLATTRADVNGVVRRRLDVRKASFTAMQDAVDLTGMAYGGITPFGLPREWPVLVDAAVAARPAVVVGSGLRSGKLIVPGDLLARLPGAEVVDELGR